VNSTFVGVPRSVLATLFGALASAAVVAMTAPPGPGLDPDSVSYLGAAESLVRHGSLRVPFADWSSPDSTSPLAHFPPGFSLAIAGPALLGADPVQAARAIEAAAAFVTVGGAVWLVAGVAGSGAGALAGVVLLASPSLAFDHWQVLSEPLCLALLVVTLGLMARGARPWSYGLTAAAAGLVRYAGAAAMGAAVLWAFGRSGVGRERLRRAAEAAAPGLLLHGAWLLREAAESGQVRSFGLRGQLGPAVRQLGLTLDAWLAPLVPWVWAAALLAVAIAALAGALVLAALRAADGPAPRPGAATARRFVSAAGLLAACYAALVLWSRLFVDETIPFDERLLSPFILLVQLAAVAALGVRWPAWRRPRRAAAAALVVLWAAASAGATVRAVSDALDGGWGYASDDWRVSPLARWLRTAGSGAAIFSDNPATVFALTHRPSRNVPRDLAPDSLAEFARAFRERPAVLVRFPFDLDPGAPPDSIAKRLGLREIATFPDGAVWGPPAPAGPARGG
jgi:hypothetical protein